MLCQWAYELGQSLWKTRRFKNKTNAPFNPMPLLDVYPKY
jgi:hypothetical protein